MVRFINKRNIHILTKALGFFIKIQERLTFIRPYNPPKVKPCIYALWHENQFGVYCVPNINNTNILISTSLDGQIISGIAELLGFKTCRGSAGRKGSISSTLKLIEKLKMGEDVAIMIDGPRGPYHEVKKGIITLSRETGCPIIPLHWYSTDITFRKFPSWDRMLSPVGPCRILALFGEPIYATKDLQDEDVMNLVKQSLLNLEKIAPEKYKEAKKNKLWTKK